MTEKRKLERRQTIYYLKVVDSKTNALAGRLTDITTDGMRLVSEKPIRSKQVFQFKIAFPEPIRGCWQMILEAESVWCGKDINRAYYGTGFRFLNVTPENKSTIEYSFESYLFPDWRTSL